MKKKRIKKNEITFSRFLKEIVRLENKMNQTLDKMERTAYLDENVKRLMTMVNEIKEESNLFRLQRTDNKNERVVLQATVEHLCQKMEIMSKDMQMITDKLITLHFSRESHALES